MKILNVRLEQDFLILELEDNVVIYALPSLTYPNNYLVKIYKNYELLEVLGDDYYVQHDMDKSRITLITKLLEKYENIRYKNSR